LWIAPTWTLDFSKATGGIPSVFIAAYDRIKYKKEMLRTNFVKNYSGVQTMEYHGKKLSL
jgi:hypothetical protein